MSNAPAPPESPEPTAAAHPSDWPGPGPVDLDVHDRPHASSDIEWWYINAHLVLQDGRDVSLFASFFRQRDESETRGARFAHTVLWGLTDVAGKRYFPQSYCDIQSPAITLERLEAEEPGARDPDIKDALSELLRTGTLPFPDMLADAEAEVATDRLSLAYGPNTFTKLPDGRYELVLDDPERGVGCRLVLGLAKPMCRHGDDGVVRGVSGGDMQYLFCPRCTVEGTVRIDGQDVPVASGWAWYDHEFGLFGEKGRTVAWNWIGAQLDDGREVTAYELIYTDDGTSAGGWAVLIDADGTQHTFSDFTFTHADDWTSTTTLIPWPRTWTLTVPAAELVLHGRVAIDHQEVVTMISEPSFYEGRIELSGTLTGEAVVGRGFLERSGFEHNRSIREHLTRVGRITRETVAELVPRRPTHRELIRMTSGEDDRGLLDGIDDHRVGALALDPIRDIIDRGGKAWRSYAVLLCRELFSDDRGQLDRLEKWLALPELLHAGSLIIDDVQDGSSIRRGDRAVHLDYGVPLAINAGNLAYFLGETVAQESDLNDAAKLRIYATYFEAVRAGHLGQALDLAGPGDLWDAAVETGDPTALLEHLEVVYRLKTAVPSQSAARIGGILADAPDEDVLRLERYFLKVGVAFQMVDDALDMEGFEDDRKVRGGDLLERKVTWPTAVALGRLDRRGRQRIADTLAAPNPAKVAQTLDLIASTGAIRDTKRQAHAIANASWDKVRPHLRPTHARVRLRALSKYLLERRR